ATTTDAKLFTSAPSSMFRRPARDRNYEFWGDQTFFGENPPQAAVITWLNKKQVGEVKLKITDATGRERREVSGPLRANSGKPGLQTAGWDLRVQPAVAPPTADGRGRGEGAQGQGGRGTQGQEQSPFGAGCGSGAAAGPAAAFGGGPGAANGGSWVLGGAYTVALVIDGKTIDTKPLRVTEDPEVLLTQLERKRMYDMAMELHA